MAEIGESLKAQPEEEEKPTIGEIERALRASRQQAQDYLANAWENYLWGQEEGRCAFQKKYGRPWEPADDYGLQYWLNNVYEVFRDLSYNRRTPKWSQSPTTTIRTSRRISTT